MIERLVATLRTLAAEPADAAVGDFDDALLLVRQCQSFHLTPDQNAALDRLERSLSLPERADGAVRAHASTALRALQPDPSVDRGQPVSSD